MSKVITVGATALFACILCATPLSLRFSSQGNVLLSEDAAIPQTVMSALPPKADMCVALAHVRFGPISDIGNSVTSPAHNKCDAETDKFLDGRPIDI
jgi:hypothetical protein